MSRTQPTDTEWAEMQFPCPTCDARRGEWCEAVRGQAALRGDDAKWLHVARWRAVREVVRLSGFEGWLESERDLARIHRRRAAILTAGINTVLGDLNQITARWPDHLVAPQPLIDQLAKALADAAKETA